MKCTITPEQEQDLTLAIQELGYPSKGITDDMDWGTVIARVDSLPAAQRVPTIKRFLLATTQMKKRKAYLLSKAMSKTEAWIDSTIVLSNSHEIEDWLMHVGRAALFDTDEELENYLRSDE